MSSTKDSGPYSRGPITSGLHAFVGVSDDFFAVQLFCRYFMCKDDGTMVDDEFEILGFHRHHIKDGFPNVISDIRVNNPLTYINIHLPPKVLVDDFASTNIMARPTSCPLLGLVTRAAHATDTSFLAFKRNTKAITLTIKSAIALDHDTIGSCIIVEKLS